MEKYLTIGEFAKLMNVSSYNIRYYEKEGLINPRYDDQSGYRYYSYEDLYTLSSVLILRENNIPIKEIKELFKNYNRKDYLQLLSNSYEKISSHIQELEKLRNAIESDIKRGQNLENELENINIKSYPGRKLFVLHENYSNIDYSLKEIYHLFKEKKLDFEDIFKKDIYIYADKKRNKLCFLHTNSEETSCHIYLAEGAYLSYKMHISDDKELFNEIELALEKIKKSYNNLGEEIVVKIDAKLSMMVTEGDIVEIQIKL